MSRRCLHRLSSAIVVVLAVVLGLGGGAFAAAPRAGRPKPPLPAAVHFAHRTQTRGTRRLPRHATPVAPGLARLQGRDHRHGDAQTLVATRTASRAATATATLPGTASTSGPGLAWGQGYDGQLGNGGEPTSVSTPGTIALPSGTTLTQVSAGNTASEGLTSTGRVLAWGDNSSGQLGDGNTTEADSPVAVNLPSGVTASAVAMGGSFGLALSTTGTVYAWGDNSSGQLGNGSSSSSSDLPVPVSLPAGTTVTQIAAGGSFALALTASGTVYAWGDNTFGELGNGTTGGESATPVPVSLPAGSTVSQLAAGNYFALALTTNGVLAWGYGNGGELGNGQGTSSATPVSVSIPAGTTVTQVAGGGGTALALTSQGTVLGWGGGGSGQLGDGSTANAQTPVRVSLPANTTISQVASGGSFGLAVTASGSAYAWGDDSYGELGNGTTGGQSTTPVAVTLPNHTAVQAIAAGAYHALAIELSAPTVTGVTPALGPFYGTTQVTISGTGFSGASAVHFGATPATSFTVTSPTSITAVAPTGSGTEDVTVTNGGGTSPTSTADQFGYVTAGSAASFGENGGALCNGQTANSDVPVTAALPAGTQVKSVAAGILLTSTGKVYTCGDNSYGQLGNGTTGGYSATPVAVSIPQGTTVTAVASNGAGDDYAITSAGRLYAWGFGGDGELGNGAAANSNVPVAVALPGGALAKGVSAGGQGALAVTTTGGVYAWGADSEGQLGNGTMSNTQSDTPVAVSLPSGVTATAVAAQYYGALALTSSGQVYAWGYGGYGENGNGSDNGSTTPVLVALPAGTRATAIAAEADAGLALTSTGAVEAWGYGGGGGLGNYGTANSDVPVPVAISLRPGVSVTSLGSQYGGGLVTTSDGQALSWGYSFGGSLGNGTMTGSDAPYSVSLPPGVLATAAGQGLGYEGTLVVAAPPIISSVAPAIGPRGGGTTVTISGQGFTGASAVYFGATKATSFTVTSPTSITAVTPAGSGDVNLRVLGGGGSSLITPGQTFGYVTSGSAVDWGYGNFGELGTGTQTSSPVALAPALASGTVVTSAAEEYYSSLVATSTGKVYSWGYGGEGALGDGHTTSTTTPVAVSLPAGTTAKAVAGEGYGGLALTSAGGVKAWGAGADGALGNGNTVDSLTPVAVALPTGTTATAIAGEQQDGLALTSTGAVYAWGYGGDGELGDGATASSFIPVKVAFPAGTVVTQIAALGEGGLALTSTGAVYAWGYGAQGELGNGTTVNSDVPVRVQIPAGTTITAVAGANESAYALTSTGRVEAWGYNGFGDLGNGATSASAVPVAVSIPAADTIVSLGSQSDGGLALTQDGQVLSWGYGQDGELGNGSDTGSQTTPVSVSLPHGVSIARLSQGFGYAPLAIVGTPPSSASPAIFATDAADNTLTAYAQGASGNASPLTSVSGSATGLSGPAGLSVTAAGDVLVANTTGNSVTEYAAGATGNAAPIATLSGSATGLAAPQGLAVDGNGDLFVADGGANAVTEYAPGATGNTAPIATLSGSATGLAGPRGLTIDGHGDLFVASSTSNAVQEFAPGARGNVAPKAVLSGSATGLSTPFGLLFDAAGNLRVSNRAANSVTAYATPSGNPAPSSTLTAGLGGPQGMDINGSGEIAVADNAANAISFYTNNALTATISGAATGLDAPAFVAFTPPPAASTGRATAVSRHAATLHGTVTPDGSVTRWWFEFQRRGTHRWLSTRTQGAGRGELAIPVSVRVTGLRAGTRYRYRLVATNPGGQTTGSVRGLRTRSAHHRHRAGPAHGGHRPGATESLGISHPGRPRRSTGHGHPTAASL